MRKMQSTNAQNFKQLVVLCPISYSLSVIGGRWKPLIIDKLLKSSMRYNELKKSMPLITERVLTLQLKELEQDGLVTKIVHQELPPKIIEYQLSPKGASLTAVLSELYKWGNANKSM